MTLNRRTVLPYVRPADDAVSDASSKARPAKGKHHFENNATGQCYIERLAAKGDTPQTRKKTADSTPVRPPG